LRKRFGSEAYAAEALIAEHGAAFLCADLGTRLSCARTTPRISPFGSRFLATTDARLHRGPPMPGERPTSPRAFFFRLMQLAREHRASFGRPGCAYRASRRLPNSNPRASCAGHTENARFGTHFDLVVHHPAALVTKARVKELSGHKLRSAGALHQ
jgi:hypothetical protein